MKTDMKMKSTTVEKYNESMAHKAVKSATC